MKPLLNEAKEEILNEFVFHMHCKRCKKGLVSEVKAQEAQGKETECASGDHDYSKRVTTGEDAYKHHKYCKKCGDVLNCS